MSKFLLSTILLLQTFTPSIVGGGELSNEIISDRWLTYNNALDMERAILERERIKDVLMSERKSKLIITKSKISRYFSTVNSKLYWSNYTRVISHLESSHRYDVVNQFGYLGKYQINKKYLLAFGYEGSDNDFLQDKLSQELVMANYTYKNINYISKYNLTRYIGKEINGIEVTLFGLMASAHLVGIKNLNTYLNTNGEVIAKDGNDTSIEKYMKIFS